jgi:SAM-dependent methyltransferase
MMDERKSREKAFHDVEYEDDSRWLRVDKYYSIMGARTSYFDDIIAARCRGRSVLEYGCGAGKYSLKLASWGATVTAMDISETAIRRAREAATAAGVTVDFRTMDAENLEFPDHSFDLICGIGILHHLDLDRSLPEVARTLKPDGVAIFMEPLGHNPLINLYRRMTPELRTVDEHPLKLSDFDFARRYFRSVDVKAFHLMSLTAVPFRRFPFFPNLVRGLDRIDAFFFRRLQFSKRYAWFAVGIFSQPIAAPRR